MLQCLRVKVGMITHERLDRHLHTDWSREGNLSSRPKSLIRQRAGVGSHNATLVPTLPAPAHRAEHSCVQSCTLQKRPRQEPVPKCSRLALPRPSSCPPRSLVHQRPCDWFESTSRADNLLRSNGPATGARLTAKVCAETCLWLVVAVQVGRFRARFCEPLQAREHACAERGWAWNLLELLQCHLRDKKIGESLALSA